MQEIDRLYGKEPKPSESRSKGKAAAAGDDGEPISKKKKHRQEAEYVEPEVDFESGFDHGFDNMATFNGRAVGKDEGQPAASSSVGGGAAASENKSGTNFDFNFDDQ